ncbi:MAG: NAD(+)/NADH kinase, partial [Actinobacteria bacterium]|nr:NAD(+)/NADH kinase [Actinomycetota bacterium]
MTSTIESTPPLASGVKRAALITHGKPETIGPALERLSSLAAELGVELLVDEAEAQKHDVPRAESELEAADVAIVLGGDGTMLRALGRYLGTDVPVVGVNFGRVG